MEGGGGSYERGTPVGCHFVGFGKPKGLRTRQRRSGHQFDHQNGSPSRPLHLHLAESVYKVVLHKSIPTQIRQLILYHY